MQNGICNQDKELFVFFLSAAFPKHHSPLQFLAIFLSLEHQVPF